MEVESYEDEEESKDIESTAKKSNPDLEYEKVKDPSPVK